jgi:hypothetical protein
MNFLDTFQELLNKDDLAISKPGLFNGESWVRFDHYEIVEGKNSILYISPAPNAILYKYKPLNEPHILVDYLELAQFFLNYVNQLGGMVTENRFEDFDTLNRHAANRALPFVNKYGLLGSIFSKLDHQYKDTVWVWQNQKNQIGKVVKQMKHQEFTKHYFPRGKAPRSIDYSKEFFSAYSEPAMDILGPGLSLLVWVNYWHEFLQSKAHPDDLIDGHKKGHTWRERFESGFIAQDVGIGLTLDIPPQITYRFKSLISALETMFILSIGSKSNQIKLCQAHCIAVAVALVGTRFEISEQEIKPLKKP